jgi:TrkA-N domain
MLLSMLLAPFLIKYSNQIVLRLSPTDWMQQSLALTQIASRTMATRQHVIICGYGRSGQNLARLLEQEDIAYVALDLDPERVIEAAAAGESVVYRRWLASRRCGGGQLRGYALGTQGLAPGARARTVLAGDRAYL